MRCMTELTADDHETIVLLFNGYLVDALAPKLESTTMLIVEDALSCFSNIAGDCASLRDELLDDNILPRILALYPNNLSRLSFLRIFSWTMSNFCRNNPEFNQIEAALPLVCELAAHEDDQVRNDAIWAMVHLSGYSPQFQTALVGHRGLGVALKSALNSKEQPELVAATRTIGNFCSSTEVLAIVLSWGVIESILPLISHDHPTLQKEACWALSKIMAEQEHVKTCLELGALESIIFAFTASHAEVKSEAAWCLLNAILAGSPDDLYQIISHPKVPEALVSLLASQSDVIVDSTITASHRLLSRADEVYKTSESTMNPLVGAMIGLGCLEVLSQCVLQNGPNAANANDLSEAFFVGYDCTPNC